MTTSKLLFYMNMREPDAIIVVDAFGKLTRTTKDDFRARKNSEGLKNGRMRITAAIISPTAEKKTILLLSMMCRKMSYLRNLSKISL